MKTLLFSLVFVGGLYAQATFPIQIPGEAAVSTTLSAEAVAATTLFVKSIPAIGPAATIALASDATNVATTFVLSSVVGVTTGMGILIDSEVSLVTAISSPNVTVTRARLGTTGAAHSSGVAVRFLRSGSYSVFIANLIADTVQQAMLSTPGPAVIAAKVQVATDQAAITTLQVAAVTHVP